MHLRDERAHRVDDLEAAALAVLLHRRRDAVRREDADRTGRDLVLGLDEDRAEPLEPAQRRGRCGRSRGGRRPAGRAPRAGARRSRSPGRRRRRTSAARRAGRGPLAAPPPAPSARGGRCAGHGVADGSRRERLQEAERPRAAVRRDRLGERRRAARRGVSRDRADAAAQAAGRRERRRSPCRPRRRRSARAGGGAPPGRRPGGPSRGSSPARPTPSRALPEHGAVLVDHAGRVDHGADRAAVQPAGDAERDELARGHASADADADPGGRVPRPSRRPLLRAVAQAEISPSASTPCSGRSPSRSRSRRMRPTARTRSGSRSARSAGRSRGRRTPTRCSRAAPRTSGRSRR